MHILLRLLRFFVHRGGLRIIDPSGRIHVIGDSSEPAASVRLGSRRLVYRIVVNPAQAIGEAYMDGQLTVEHGTIYDFLAVLAQNYPSGGGPAWLGLIESISRGLKQHNPVGKARQNVARHYDLTDALFALFLIPDRQYRCAYFMHPDESLETAQENKKRHVAAKLLLDQPGLRVLDIGSGWGGLRLFLARQADVAVTGVTLSTEQHKVSQARAAAAELADRVQFRLRDYREENKSLRSDRIDRDVRACRQAELRGVLRQASRAAGG